ncbi:acyl-CoA thioesterase, partial [Staphylococcus aureus]|nr:acyl-CoA thioesterase [Staphylococcus aureus]
MCFINLDFFTQELNLHHSLFGCNLLANIDVFAAITAMKHAGAQV